MTPPFGVIADDFTGACDVAVQFNKRGLETLVLARIGGLDSVSGAFDVVVLDTESRNVALDSTYNRVRRILKDLKEIGIELVYEKIDSTLRGNIGADLDAVLDELGVKAVILTPTLPAHKRTTVNGHLLVNNVPLERTEFAQDPLHPIHESHIPTLIGRQTKRRIGHVQLPKVRSRAAALKDEILRLIDDGNQIIVADAETQSDLARIAEASFGSDILPCGSAGLAEEISRRLTPRSGFLVVSGSVNTVTLSQIAMAEKELGIRVIEPDLSKVLTSEEGLQAVARDITNEAEKALSQGKDVTIRLARSKEMISEIQRLGEELGISRQQVVERLLSVLGESSKTIVENHRLAGLVLIGGDTSVRVIEALVAEGLRIEDEALPGVPLGRVIGGKHEGMPVVTKAGGFGDPGTLIEIIGFLRRRVLPERSIPQRR